MLVLFSSCSLFTYVNEDKLFSKPTYSSFIKLLNNYHKKVGMGEKFSAEQLQEQDTFLAMVMKTEVMKELYRFLQSKSKPLMITLKPINALTIIYNGFNTTNDTVRMIGHGFRAEKKRHFFPYNLWARFPQDLVIVVGLNCFFFFKG